ncbi:ABC transporter [Lactiplantibacillus plajomi]|uniref:ABC transporter n=1 Tax=Lactiplantibacillus plajomi TaxID=1457217 RepID=A0ABV6K1D1_9LACO|nr:ABC transporter [Lactiplantibacillus plajomi]
MITWIQLKQVLRNKRFIFFTIVFPATWYLLPSVVNPRMMDPFIAFLIASLMGIIGNSIVTFSKRISAGRQFYLAQARLSRYSVWRYMFSQLIIQVCLHLLIILAITLLGVALKTLPINVNYWCAVLWLSVLGLYFSVIGFWFGMSFSPMTVDVGSTPLMFLFALMIVPFSLFSTSTLTGIIAKVQALLPPYYFYQFFHQWLTNQATDGILWKFGLSALLTLIPFMVALRLRLFGRKIPRRA